MHADSNCLVVERRKKGTGGDMIVYLRKAGKVAVGLWGQKGV
jgi:hypothetical protein